MAARGESLGSGEATRVLRVWFARSGGEVPKLECLVLANAATAAACHNSQVRAPRGASNAPRTVLLR